MTPPARDGEMGPGDDLLRVQDLVDAFAPRVVAAGGTRGLERHRERHRLRAGEPHSLDGARGRPAHVGHDPSRRARRAAPRLIRELHASGKAGSDWRWRRTGLKYPDTMIDSRRRASIPAFAFEWRPTLPRGPTVGVRHHHSASTSTICSARSRSSSHSRSFSRRTEARRTSAAASRTCSALTSCCTTGEAA